MTDTSRTIIRGGEVFDPSTGTIAVADVFVAGPSFATPFGATTSDRVIEAAGLLVTPGWVDLHTHVFVGQDLGVDPNVLGPTTGVTTLIDAGSAGAHLYDAFVTSVLRDAVPRVRAFLNISTVGTTSILLAGELRQLDYVDEAACIAVIGRHPEILGVKVRASANVGAENTAEALRRARRVADDVDLPLMVHIGPAPVTYGDVLGTLRRGDIVTHCFSGYPETPIADPDRSDRLWDAALQARERGVLFDVGHGGGSFDAQRAAAAVRAGFLPDTISSDVHAYSDLPGGGVVVDQDPGSRPHRSLVEQGLPLVVDKMIALGMRLEDALARVTAAPAAAAGMSELGIGTLRPGAPADLALFRIKTGTVSLTDSQGLAFSGDRSLVPQLTLQSGAVVFDARSTDR